ncbi:MAG: AI-2E family transporter [Deltaproteobacteria bacterium]|jgi:predicted PurR-regulated permease PerM|nr:AI-2E family transporter [Deltaproteobacteria bacterium]MBT4525664.1 AI-2E family transporter [Deltaproteobacteria bacterium]
MNLTIRLRYIIISLLFLIFIALVYTFRAVLPTFILALLLAYILTPVVVKISSKKIFRRKIPRGMAIIVIYVLSITGISFGGTYFVVNLTNEMQILVKEFPSYGKKIKDNWVPTISSGIQKITEYMPKMNFDLPEEITEKEEVKPVVSIDKEGNANEIINYLTNTTFEIKKNKKGYEVIPHHISKSKKVDQTQDLDFTKMFNDFLGNFIQNLQGMLVGLLDLSQMVVFSIVSSIFQTMITLMVAAFIIIDYERILHFFRDLFPARFVDNIELFLQKQNVGLHGVVRGQLIICVVNGFLTWIGLLIFDIKFALTLSILATICSLIPIFGVIISSIPIVLMAITNSIYSGLFVLAWILGIHFIEGNILNPKIIGKSAEIHPVLVIFALMAGELTYGLFGALIAVPVFSILQTTFLFVRENVLSDIKAQ